MFEIYNPQESVSSYLSGDYEVDAGRNNDPRQSRLPILSLKELISTYCISKNSMTFGNLFAKHWETKGMPPFYNELHSVKGVNVEPIDNHTRIYDDKKTFEVLIQEGDVNDCNREFPPFCIDYKLYDKPPWELLLMLSSLSYSRKIAVFKAVNGTYQLTKRLQRCLSLE